MRIDNNLGAMMSSAIQIQDNANKIAEVANVASVHEFQESTRDFTSAMVEQIPEIIAYSANAKSIEVQAIAMERLLDIKA
ncbi:hypothetical protein [Aliarcobacter skirrowii]|uniref:hypothetical protein n=1 Tax=Aliarcobacter skirrowii TaxID=28200 RepID=UPI0021B36182|nr:hypothetical protein [Aliarcobacter skirrowii]MCT7446703.1 hypothetical protein [Aliarcobacter skirrowii]